MADATTFRQALMKRRCSFNGTADSLCRRLHCFTAWGDNESRRNQMADWGNGRLNFQPRMNTDCAMEAGKSGRGLPQSKTWRKFQRAGEREASWTAPAFWRFGTRQCQFRMPPGQLAAPQSDGRAGARVSPPAAASPELTVRDFLDADWTVHALRLGGRSSGPNSRRVAGG